MQHLLAELHAGWRGQLCHQGLLRWLSWGSRIDYAKPSIASMQSHLLPRGKAQEVPPHLASTRPAPGRRRVPAGRPVVLPRGWNEGAAAPCGSKAGLMEASISTSWGGGGRRLGEALPAPSLTGRGFPHRPPPKLLKLRGSQPGGSEKPFACLPREPLFPALRGGSD